MMREYHVRICERLGVKLPGPTRHIDPNPISIEAFCSMNCGPAATERVKYKLTWVRGCRD